MNLHKLVYLTITGIAFISCQHDEIELSKNDYIVFGDYYGECHGSSCINIYRLETDRLLVDTKKQYPRSTDFYVGEFTQTDSAKYNAVKDIVKYFPEELLSMNEDVIGLPDAGDWGGFYIEYNYNGKHRHWLLDKMKNNVPVSLHKFIDKLNEKLEYLRGL